MRRSRLTITATLLCLGLWPPDAQSQVVAGSVHDAVTQTPVSGAAVLLLGPSRETIARTVSSSSGTFRVRGDGAVTLRVMRIGYSPHERRLDASTTHRVVLTPLGRALRAVSVRSSAVCPSRRDQSEALAWWSAATDALLAMVIASDSSGDGGAVAQLQYNRLLSDDGRRVVRQSTRTVLTANANPIRAGRAPETFVRDGYVVTRGDVMTYYGPDAAVLLDSSFAATHCLSLRTDRARPDQVGVAFTPTRDRASIPDIAGVMWMTRQPLALVSLDFEYRGVDQAIMGMRAGGRLDFEMLGNGVPIVRAWHVRSPKLGFLPSGRVVRGRVVADGAMAHVLEVHETGGLVIDGRLVDGTIVTAALATLGGRVLNDPTGDPVPGAVVTLDSTDVAVTTDSAGQFLLERLLPGPYTLRVSDVAPMFAARVDSLGNIVPNTSMQQVVRRVTTLQLEARMASITPVDVPLHWRARVDGCGRGEQVERRYLVLGVVLTSDSTPVPHAEVRLAWADTSRGSTRETSVDATADAGGGFVMCGIPAGRPLATRITVPQRGEFLGATTVNRVDYDELGRRRSGTLRAIKLVISDAPPERGR